MEPSTDRFLTTEEVMKEFNLPRNFVIKWAPMMGNISRPRRFNRETVRAFLDAYTQSKIEAARSRSLQKIRSRQIVDEILEEVLGKYSTRLTMKQERLTGRGQKITEK